MSKVDRELAPWNGAAALVFAVVLVASYVFLVRFDAITLLYRLTGLDLLLISLAAFRITHLLTFDKILNAVREYFMDGEGSSARKPRPGFRRLMCELLECIWCTSMWAGLIAFILYAANPFLRFVDIVLAIAGAASLLQVVSKKISEMTT